MTAHNAAVSKAEDVVASFTDNLERFGSARPLRHVFDWEAQY